MPTRTAYIYNVNIYTFFEIKLTHFQTLTKYCYLILQLFLTDYCFIPKNVCIFALR